MPIALKALLNLESQASHAATHVGVARVNPNADAARDRDHRRRNSSRTCCSASPPTLQSTRTRQAPPSSMSMIPALARCAGGEDAGCGASLEIGAATGVISTGTRAGTGQSLAGLPSGRTHALVLGHRARQKPRRLTTDPGSQSNLRASSPLARRPSAASTSRRGPSCARPKVAAARSRANERTPTSLRLARRIPPRSALTSAHQRDAEPEPAMRQQHPQSYCDQLSL
ncbi:hypothetical protein ACVIM9_008323 [Bradyrhizobium sp. USDA 4520]